LVVHVIVADDAVTLVAAGFEIVGRGSTVMETLAVAVV